MFNDQVNGNGKENLELRNSGKKRKRKKRQGAPFDKPFDKLKAASMVEWLRAVSKVEPQERQNNKIGMGVFRGDEPMRDCHPFSVRT
jgi:hypothetical protein